MRGNPGCLLSVAEKILWEWHKLIIPFLTFYEASPVTLLTSQNA